MQIVDMPEWVGSVPVLLAITVLIVDLVLRVAALGIIPGNRKPSSAMAWLLLILLVPVPGLALFLLLGNNKLGGRRHAKQAEVNARIHERTAHLAPLETGSTVPG